MLELDRGFRAFVEASTADPPSREWVERRARTIRQRRRLRWASAIAAALILIVVAPSAINRGTRDNLKTVNQPNDHRVDTPSTTEVPGPPGPSAAADGVGAPNPDASAGSNPDAGVSTSTPPGATDADTSISQPVLIHFSVQKYPSGEGALSTFCGLFVRPGADGITVLHTAVAQNCIASYTTKESGGKTFIACINDVCAAAVPGPSGVAASWYVASEDYYDYTATGLEGYRAVSDSNFTCEFP